MSRVLIADDEPQQLSLRRVLLEAAGHEVAVACNAPETRLILAELQPEVLVMDLCLPKLKDGLALIRLVHEQHPAAKVIVLSGWPEELYDLPEEKLVECVLGKPIRNDALLQAISAAASSRARSPQSTSS